VGGSFFVSIRRVEMQKPIVMTLCYKCKQNFIEAGNRIKRNNYSENEVKEECDYCGYRMGFEYLIDKKRN
jgi:RNase P subunit RPR2